MSFSGGVTWETAAEPGRRRRKRRRATVLLISCCSAPWATRGRRRRKYGGRSRREKKKRKGAAVIFISCCSAPGARAMRRWWEVRSKRRRRKEGCTQSRWGIIVKGSSSFFVLHYRFFSKQTVCQWGLLSCRVVFSVPTGTHVNRLNKLMHKSFSVPALSPSCCLPPPLLTHTQTSWITTGYKLNVVFIIVLFLILECSTACFVINPDNDNKDSPLFCSWCYCSVVAFHLLPVKLLR